MVQSTLETRSGVAPGDDDMGPVLRLRFGQIPTDLVDGYEPAQEPRTGWWLTGASYNDVDVDVDLFFETPRPGREASDGHFHRSWEDGVRDVQHRLKPAVECLAGKWAGQQVVVTGWVPTAYGTITRVVFRDGVECGAETVTEPVEYQPLAGIKTTRMQIQFTNPQRIAIDLAGLTDNEAERVTEQSARPGGLFEYVATTGVRMQFPSHAINHVLRFPAEWAPVVVEDIKARFDANGGRPLDGVRIITGRAPDAGEVLGHLAADVAGHITGPLAERVTGSLVEALDRVR